MIASSNPIRHWIIDNWCQPVPSKHVPAIDSPLWEVDYENDCESGKLTTRKVKELSSLYGEIFEDMCDEKHLLEWSDAIGVNLVNDTTRHGAGLHVMKPGGYLGVHLDFARHPVRLDMERRLSMIAFLHPKWEIIWGGELIFCNPMGETIVQIEPRPGRLVVWESSDLAYHGVRRIEEYAGLRVTAAAYFMAQCRAQATRQRALFMPNRSMR